MQGGARCDLELLHARHLGLAVAKSRDGPQHSAWHIGKVTLTALIKGSR